MHPHQLKNLPISFLTDMNYLKLYQKFGAHDFLFSWLGNKMVERKNKVLTYDKETTCVNDYVLEIKNM